MTPPSLARFAWVAIAASVAVIALKGTAWLLTGSVGLLSDALESLANLAGAIMAYLMLLLAARPPDEDHHYGHGKAEYFASGFEGALILIAAAAVAVAAIPRLIHPRPLESVGLGLVVAGIATVINFLVARFLFQVGSEEGSITLEATGHHLMTDVWTSGAVIGGVAVVSVTGWHRLDAILALAVAGHIVHTGVRLMRRSAMGLLDTALPEERLDVIRGILARYEADGIQFHALRTRRAGRHNFISFHVLVPGSWTVQRGHDLVEEIEAEMRDALPRSTVLTHLEPVEDPVSFEDTSLHRGSG